MSSDTPSNRRLVRAARRFAQLPGGRRTKFAVIGVWLLIAMAIGPLSGKFEEVQKNDPIDYLPGSAESVQALQALEEFPSGDEVDAITVFARDGVKRDRAVAPLLEFGLQSAVNFDFLFGGFAQFADEFFVEKDSESLVCVIEFCLEVVIFDLLFKVRALPSFEFFKLSEPRSVFG